MLLFEVWCSPRVLITRATFEWFLKQKHGPVVNVDVIYILIRGGRKIKTQVKYFTQDIVWPWLVPTLLYVSAETCRPLTYVLGSVLNRLGSRRFIFSVRPTEVPHECLFSFFFCRQVMSIRDHREGARRQTVRAVGAQRKLSSYAHRLLDNLPCRLLRPSLARCDPREAAHSALPSPSFYPVQK